MKTHRQSITVVVLGLSLCCISGCGDQADTNYPGERLASLSGVAKLEGTPPAGDSFVHLLWFRTEGSSDTTSVDKVPLQPQGSAIGFTFNFYSPPPSGAFNDYSEGGKYPQDTPIALGYLAAMGDGFNPALQEDSGEQEPWADSYLAGLLLGLATQHVLIYAENDVQPNTFSNFLLNDTLPAGFHIMEVQPLSETEKQTILACQETASSEVARRACGSTADRLVEAPQQMSTIIPLEIPNDPSVLHWPRWLEPHDYRDVD